MKTFRENFLAILAAPSSQRLDAIDQLPDLHRVYFVLVLALTIPVAMLGFQGILWVLGAFPRDYVLAAVSTGAVAVLNIGRVVLAGLGGGHEGVDAFTTLMLGNFIAAYVVTVIRMVMVHQNDKALNDTYYAVAIRKVGKGIEKLVLAGLFLFTLVATAGLGSQPGVNVSTATQVVWVIAMLLVMGTLGAVAYGIRNWNLRANMENRLGNYAMYITAAIPALLMGMNLLNFGLYVAWVVIAVMLNPLAEKLLRGSAQAFARETAHVRA